MKNILKFAIFIGYTVSIFLIKDIRIIAGLFCLNWVITIILPINFKNIFYNLKILLPFIIFTMLMNFILDSIQAGVLIGVKLVICYHVTYIFSKTMTISELASTIQNLCFPLKLFKVNTHNISIMISIAICMVPILKNEMNTLLKAMKSKGQKITIKSFSLMMKPMLISVFRKTSQMEKTLMAKGYTE